MELIKKWKYDHSKTVYYLIRTEDNYLFVNAHNGYATTYVCDVIQKSLTSDYKLNNVFEKFTSYPTTIINAPGYRFIDIKDYISIWLRQRYREPKMKKILSRWNS